MKPPLPTPKFATGGSRITQPENRGIGASSEGVNFSVSWKGWTNGGGERASTAAQFSRLAEGMPVAPQQHTFTGSPSLSAVRGAAPATPAAAAGPVFTVSQGESVVGPMNAAIERIVSRGLDQLSVTVRFESGGSVSIKLAMRGGEIATHIHTDLPGLEQGLRASWNQLAHDWEGRGWKLANPSFSTGAQTDDSGHGARQHASRGDERGEPGFGSGSRDFNSAWTQSIRTDGSIRSAAHRARPATHPVSGDKAGLHTWA